MTQVHSLKAANQVHRLRNCEREKENNYCIYFSLFCPPVHGNIAIWSLAGPTPQPCVSVLVVWRIQDCHLTSGKIIVWQVQVYYENKAKRKIEISVSSAISLNKDMFGLNVCTCELPWALYFSTHLSSWPDPPVCLACWLLFSARDLGNFCYWVVYPLLPRIITQQTFCFCFFVLLFLVMQTHKLFSKLLGNFIRKTPIK